MILDEIRVNTNMIRSALGIRVRHQLRIVPTLQFYLDDTAEYVEKIEKLFEGIVIPPAN
jgi:ribosome-binding factor A